MPEEVLMQARMEQAVRVTIKGIDTFTQIFRAGENLAKESVVVSVVQSLAIRQQGSDQMAVHGAVLLGPVGPHAQHFLRGVLPDLVAGVKNAPKLFKFKQAVLWLTDTAAFDCPRSEGVCHLNRGYGNNLHLGLGIRACRCKPVSQLQVITGPGR
jgi:hypothetical protein